MAWRIRAEDVADLIRPFHDEGDEQATKSQELLLGLLSCASTPFSRDHFTPGHITATAVVLCPARKRFLLVHHRRLDRWLLPGGHVEEEDRTLGDTARREAIEETGVELMPDYQPPVVGMDVHGIPPRRAEPYHLHHDVIFRFAAKSDRLTGSDEARDVTWATVSEFDRFQLPVSIRRSVLRGSWGW
jgi:8-oxo-dGTP pyrophosphatase MutT (NUDIX family)